MNSRPVDQVPTPAPFAFSRNRALDLMRCARCGHDIRSLLKTEEDEREYEISALCPKCWNEIMEDVDE